MIPIPDMPSLEQIQEFLKVLANGADVVTKIADALKRWRNAPRPEDRRTVEQEIEELQADLQRLADLLTQYFTQRREFMEAAVRLLGPMDAPEGERNVDRIGTWLRMIANMSTIIPNHEERLLALERARRGGVD